MTESKRATRIARYHARARERGVNPIVYWITRAIIQPFFHLYFRLSRIGREHIPETGSVIFAANHRSFMDQFIMGVCSRRPIYYVAKRSRCIAAPATGTCSRPRGRSSSAATAC